MSKILLYNAKIWRRGRSLYSWMVFDQNLGQVLECGNNAPPSCSFKEKIDLKEQWVFPGFHDSHMHVTDTGKSLVKKNYDLGLPKTVAEFKNRLKEFANETTSDGTWIEGTGWDHTIMDRMPTCDDIDEVIPDHPVVLYRVCIHIAVVNSKAMNIAGITLDTKDPENGALDRFPEDHSKCGQRNGVLREDGGLNLILKHIPPCSSEEKKKHILAALNKCMTQGLTSVHTCDSNYWNEYVELAKLNLLPIHCYCSPFAIDLGTSNFPSQPGESYNNLTCDFVKVFIDGALGTETAALSMPYTNKNQDGSDNYGVMQKTYEEFKSLMCKINEMGFRLEIHVIGDQAAKTALDLLEDCNVSPSKRPIFVHCQILSPELIKRMKERGAVATLQPSFVPTDAAWIKNRLPEGLLPFMYPSKSLLKEGVICGGSSDSPVETTDPLQGLYDAIFRKAADGTVLRSEECLSFAEAVDMYTVGSAYADGVENFKGQLEANFRADFVVLDVGKDENGDIIDVPEAPQALKQTKVKEVWVGGIRKVGGFV